MPVFLMSAFAICSVFTCILKEPQSTHMHRKCETNISAGGHAGIQTDARFPAELGKLWLSRKREFGLQEVLPDDLLSPRVKTAFKSAWECFYEAFGTLAAIMELGSGTRHQVMIAFWAFIRSWNTLSLFIRRWLRRSCDFSRFYFFKITFTEIVLSFHLSLVGRIKRTWGLVQPSKDQSARHWWLFLLWLRQ